MPGRSRLPGLLRGREGNEWAIRPHVRGPEAGNVMSETPVTRSTNKPGRTLTIVGAVLAVLALVVLPIVLGPVGAVLGFVGYSKGDKPVGLYVGIGGIVTTIVGILIGVAMFQSLK